MDKNLLTKFFRNQCTPEEIEKVLDWFQTEEGERYFLNNLDEDVDQYADDDQLFLYPEIPSKKILQKIRHSKKKTDDSTRSTAIYWQAKAIAVFLIITLLGSTGWYFLTHENSILKNEQKISFRTISTETDQHRILNLSDGTQVRLNSSSSIKIPAQFSTDERFVTLIGEAWFNVAKDNNRPFRIQAGQAEIQVLGTEFNVKMDRASGNIEVAVAEGKVSLNNREESNGRAAILTENTFALFNNNHREILIEHTPVNNYMSWISGKLFFYNEPLWIVSRYLERLYNVSFQFENQSLRQLPLSSNMAKDNLTSVLNIISQTLGISYTLENNTVTWQVDNFNLQTETQ